MFYNQDSTSCENLHSRFGSQLHWFVPSGLRDWMTMLIEVDEANVHDMVWWQKKRHPITNATVSILLSSNETEL
jgi:hypothetical protein